MRDPIYLDNLSTTAVDPRVVEAMEPYLRGRYGHPGSQAHAFGWDAEKGVETARARVADLIGAEAREIVFTSGGTEADNLALKGVAEAYAARGRHLITTAIERPSVLESCAWLKTQGWQVTVVAPDATGQVRAADIERALLPETVLISIQLANHEVGTLQPIREIGALAREHGILLHCDAAVAAAWQRVDVRELGTHLLSLSAHRLYGPKGIGALYVRRRKPRVRLAPQMHGGGHERGLRSGTINVPGAVGFGVAADLCRTQRAADAERIGTLRDGFEATLQEKAQGVRILGHPAERLPGCSNLTVEGVEGESLIVALPEIALTTGSACSSTTLDTSSVLRAMGLDRQIADTSVRFSLGRFTTEAEMHRAAERVIDVVARLRAMGRGLSG